MGIKKSHKNILVIDDEPLILRLLKRMLTQLGYQFDIADSEQEAIMIVQEKQFDLIIIDVKMPNVCGYEIAKKIISYKPNQKIIMMSGCGYLDKTRIQNKNTLFLEKPFSFDDFKLILNLTFNLVK